MRGGLSLIDLLGPLVASSKSVDSLDGVKEWICRRLALWKRDYIFKG